MAFLKPFLYEVEETPPFVSKGDVVLLRNKQEQFWAQIVGYMDEHLLGRVASKLTKTKKYCFGDLIEFKDQNILQAGRVV